MIKGEHLLGAVVACSGLLAVPLAAQDFDDLVSLANRGDAQKALRQVDAFVRRKPTHLEAQFLRGVLLAELDRTVEAERAFDRLTADCPGSPEIFNNLAVLQAFSGRYATAVASLTSLTARHPDFQLGQANLESVRLRKASAYDPLRDNAAPIGLILALDMGGCKPLPPSPSVAVAQAPPAAVRATRTDSAVSGSRVNDAPPPPAREALGTGNGAIESMALDVSEVRKEVLRVVAAWAEAWDDQRVDDYLNFYGKHFSPPSPLKRDAWEAQRRSRLTRPEFIDIDLGDVSFKMGGPKSASATFRQAYRSNGFMDTVTKTLKLALEEDEWKIVLETAS